YEHARSEGWMAGMASNSECADERQSQADSARETIEAGCKQAEDTNDDTSEDIGSRKIGVACSRSSNYYGDRKQHKFPRFYRAQQHRHDRDGQGDDYRLSHRQRDHFPIWRTQ